MTSPHSNGAAALLKLKEVNMHNENVSLSVADGNSKILAKLSGNDFEYWMRKDKVTIGRNSSHGKVDINVEMSSYISRRHLQINFERGRFFLYCLGKNGVFVNGQFHRLGANPFPLDKACSLRFPSTSIQLSFDPHPVEAATGITNGDSPQFPVVQQTEAKLVLPSDYQMRTGASNLTLPPLMHSKSVSPMSNPPLLEPKVLKPEREFSSPLKYVLPLPRETRGFLSAPPSPTGTISAINSCPASPRSGTPHFLTQNNVAENLSAAAAVLEKRDDKFAGDGVDSKPPYSYAQLIIQAISSAPKRQLTLSGIYAHITKNYPYYRTADKGWQNSIRHNLSLNRYFVKVPRSQEESGKGSFWRVDPASERKLVEQAWRKRRQRAVACFCSSITSSVSTLTRSAPVSPEHSSSMSPIAALPVNITSTHEEQSSDTDSKVQFVQFTTRYAQSAPGSPANLRHGVAMTTIADGNSISRNTQQATLLASASALPITDSKRNQVIWPLHATSQAAGAHQPPFLQAAIIKADKSKDVGDVQAYNAAVIETSKLPSVLPISGTSTANLTTIATFTPQQHQLFQQAQSLQHQVVMMSGPGGQRVQQAIPINVGTLVAASNNMVPSAIPFVVPVNQQQYIVRRASEENSGEPGAKKAKQDEIELKVKSNE